MNAALRSLTLMILVTAGLSCSERTKAAHPDEAGVRTFLQKYFSTWSAQDMEGYGSCFAAEARVTYVEKDGKLFSQGLTDFLHGQKMGHETSTVPMKEVPDSMEISGDALVAQAAVKWTLTKGSEVHTGLDYFTLRHGSDGWKIVSLVFYQH